MSAHVFSSVWYCLASCETLPFSVYETCLFVWNFLLSLEYVFGLLFIYFLAWSVTLHFSSSCEYFITFWVLYYPTLSPTSACVPVLMTFVHSISLIIHRLDPDPHAAVPPPEPTPLSSDFTWIFYYAKSVLNEVWCTRLNGFNICIFTQSWPLVKIFLDVLYLHIYTH